ncbi:receptor-type tyrosine-protein phosphatase T-like isoform X2 [Haliotis rufescens]|uniref:receptor-type tyrosine-protein phosphatase T-like isoform X2 n=1 Tax=Haliotis rufescens TaxID=6454 RepID=UPI00201EA36F|nr:receptor-type tyrosine-protein phosphatase T-like isoform X2 [Haliotis rufescens]
MARYLGTAVLCMILLGQCSCSCPYGTYGFQCGYRCNCDQDKCDSTSGCSPPACHPGWSGPTCQKHNIARKKATSSSGDNNFPSSKATDGNTDANSYLVCIDTAPSNPNWWRVDLNDTVLIREVTIYFRTDYTPRRNGIQVYLTNSIQVPSGLNCYNVTNRNDGMKISNVTHAPCHGRGRYLLLYTTVLPVMDFCEVEVDVCDPGTFGDDCDHYCHCKDGPCDYTTGDCPTQLCQPGWTGNSCATECSNTYGDGCSKLCSSRHCEGTASSACDHVRGACENGCKAGWKDTDCTQECVDDLEYGVGCLQNCSARMCQIGSGTCPRDTGRCIDGCQAGWRGEDCTIECILNVNYGSGCQGSCSARKCREGKSPCPKDTGRCDGGCLPGWDGEDCTSECSNTYGDGCSKPCSSRHCEGTASSACDHVTGACENGCKAGWKDTDCTQECADGLEYGVGCLKNCSARFCQIGSSTCARDTGQCTDGCRGGWKGVDCREECISNMDYGPGCQGNCSARKCKAESGTCPRDTGRCEGGCEPGWEGVDCMLKCQSPTFGVNCSSTCGHCLNNETCHHVTGTCLKGCSPGWVNDTCQRECQSRTFGVNCSLTCGHCIDNEPCHHVNGTCLVGCSPGWSNDNCQRVKSQSASSSPGNGGAIGGAIGGVVAVAAVVVTVVAVFFYRRKRKANSKTKEHSVYEDVSAFEPHVLELQAPRVNDGYEEEEPENEAGVSNTPDTYYNIGPVIVTEVAADKLGDRIRDMQATKHGFENEYQRLISGFTHTYEDSQLEGNTGKNRFLQYYPYDYNRVVLDKLPGDPSSDYVNASYINGFSKKQAYIAAQAPNKKTVADFWRMIYQKNLTKIVMLTNLVEMGKVKCEPYWSDTSDLEAGPFTITVTKVIHRASWVIRELTATLSETGENKMFYQFHFTKWPDHGTPDEMALMELLWRVRKTPNPDNSPLLVHCSAGIGRTGTYIAVDYLLDRALRDQKVDVFRFANDMRRQRRNMIQTKEQYACVYTTLHEVLTVGDTFLASLDFIKRRGRKEVFKMGNMAVPTLIQRVKSDIQRAKSGTNMKGRVWVDGRTDILAVVMPSHLSVNGYLLTEAPSVTTASLFWKLTEEQESSTVIILPDRHQSMSCVIPAPGESLDLSPVSVRCSTENTINPDIVLRNIHRQMEGDASSQTVRVYMLRRLPRGDHSVLLDLLEQVDLGTRDNTPNPVTVVFGENEKRVATLFCILSNIVLGMKYDNEVEIYNNIRRLGHLHANDLTQDEISVCYDLASTYLETQNVYANM